MSYDPTARGALCHLCPLGPDGVLRDKGMAWRPVGPELHENATVAIVGECPSESDTRHGRPYAGDSGLELNQTLTACGRGRVETDLFLTIACQPPGKQGGAYKRLTAKLRQLNKTAEQPIPHPYDCCRPRLQSETTQYVNVIALGGTALTAMTGINKSILKVRGDLVDMPEGRKVLPTVSPSFVLHSPAYREALQRDVGKAFRWFNDRLNWTEPDVVYNPSVTGVELWLRDNIPGAPFVTFDYETDDIEAMTTKVRCFSLSIPDLTPEGRCADPARDEVAQVSRAMAINLLSGDGRKRFYSASDELRIIAMVASVLQNYDKPIVGHNLGYFDKQVALYQWGVRINNIMDTLIAARFRAPEMPKGLKPNGRMLTDVHRWDSDEKGEDHATAVGKTPEEIARKDRDRLIYCSIDTTVNARITKPLINSAEAQGAFKELPDTMRPVSWGPEERWDLWNLDHKTQEMCVEMHQLGVYVDQEERARLQAHYTASAEARLKRLHAIAEADGFPRINPLSADQVRDLLYEHWDLGIPPGMKASEFYTETDLPGTNNKVLLGHLARQDVPIERREYIQELRLYRRERLKVLSTTLRPLNPHDTRSIIWGDGRVRSTWGNAITAVARLNSRKPINLQNQAKKAGLKQLRRMFRAAPGHVLIGGDINQAHLRIIANYWAIPSLQETYLNGWDPYLRTAGALFGPDDLRRGGWSGDYGDKPEKGAAATMRQSAKTYLLSSLYWAEPITKQLVIASTEMEDPDRKGETKLPYLNIDARKVEFWDRQWHRDEPGWMLAWRAAMRRYEANGGWLEEPVLGRRSGCLNGGEKNDVVNYEILAGEASIARLMEQRILDAFPFQCDGPGTGLVAQLHDGWILELEDRGPEENQRRAKLLEECITMTLPGWPVPMTSESAVGYTWADLG